MPVGFFAARRLRFDNPAEMTVLYHAPQMNKPPSDGANPLVIEVFVDTNGRALDYRILSSPLGVKDLPMQVKNQLIFTTFRPATFNGTPATGWAVLTFSDNELLSTP